MSILGYDGFDGYANLTQMFGRWTSVAGSGLTFSTSIGRFGGGGFQAPPSTTDGYVRTPAFTLANTIGAGMAIKISAGGLNTTSFGPIIFLKGGLQQCRVMVYGDGTIGVNRGGTVIGTSSLTMSVNAWHWLEVKCTARTGTNGSIEIRVSGVVFLTVSGVNLAATAADGIDTVGFGNLTGASSGFSLTIDDCVWWNTTVDTHNGDFTGDCRVQTLVPNGAGASTDWTPSTGSNWSCVNALPPSTGTPFVSSSTVAQRDLYTMTDLLAGTQPPLAVQSVMVVLDTDAGARTIRTVLKSGATTDTSGTPFTPSTTLQGALGTLYRSDPNTSAAWTTANVNALQNGQEVVT